MQVLFCFLKNLPAWVSFLCGPVNAYQVTSRMRNCSDKTISPGFMSSLF